MSVPGSIGINVVIAFAVIIVGGYAAGRAHQFRRRDLEKQIAYNDGYQQASRTLFPVAVRSETHRAVPPVGVAEVVVLRARGRARPHPAAPVVQPRHQHYRVSGSVQYIRAS
jgi:hypothetical protein